MTLPRRKHIRLPDYDYSTPGAYFVTICTENRRCTLSEITAGDAALGVPQEHAALLRLCVKKHLKSSPNFV